MTYLHYFVLVIMQINLAGIFSSKHLKINFFKEKEKDCCLPFLDVNSFEENGKLTTNIY